MLGLGRARVSQLMKEPDWPAEAARLSVGKVWWYRDVAAWAERSGRPVHPVPPR